MNKSKIHLQPCKIRPLEVNDMSKEYRQIVLLFLQKVEKLTGVERRMITTFVDRSTMTQVLLKNITKINKRR